MFLGLPKLSQRTKTTQSVSMLALGWEARRSAYKLNYMSCGFDRGLTVLFPLQIQLKSWLRSAEMSTMKRKGLHGFLI